MTTFFHLASLDVHIAARPAGGRGGIESRHSPYGVPRPATRKRERESGTKGKKRVRETDGLYDLRYDLR